MTLTSRRLKFCVRRPIVNGIGAAAEHDDPSWPRYVRITDIAGPRKLRDETFMSLPHEQAQQAPFDVGDILAAAVGATFGKTYLHLHDIGRAAFAGYLVRISPNDEFDPGFVAYWTESQHYWDQVNTSVVQSTIQNFSAAKYAELRIPSPSLLLQRAIVRFLDRETDRLDALVAAKQRVLDLLAEKRKAIIATAVTRGLDPKVNLRDSGVPWLGEIPAHWEHRNLRFCCTSIQTGGTPAPEFLDYEGEDGVDWLTPGDFTESLVPERSSRRVAPGALSAGDLKMFPRGAVLVVGIGATLGKVALLKQVASANQQVNALTPREDVDGAYLAFEMSVLGDLLRVSANTATLPILNQQRMGDVTVLVPPLDEQQAIVEHITRKTAKLDAVRAATERTIALLKERRSALIAAAVSGQLDVGATA